MGTLLDLKSPKNRGEIQVVKKENWLLVNINTNT